MLACACVYCGVYSKKLSTVMKRIVKSWAKKERSRQRVPRAMLLLSGPLGITAGLFKLRRTTKHNHRYCFFVFLIFVFPLDLYALVALGLTGVWVGFLMKKNI